MASWNVVYAEAWGNRADVGVRLHAISWESLILEEDQRFKLAAAAVYTSPLKISLLSGLYLLPTVAVRILTAGIREANTLIIEDAEADKLVFSLQTCTVNLYLPMGSVPAAIINEEPR
jgi:hypothetical protein